MLDYYLTQIKTSIIIQFQYRVANLFYFIGMLAEPIIYLVVWSTVADSQGGAVAGYTAGEFAAYYIVWTLVRQMNIVLTPYAWEYYIKQGHFSAMLLRPVHPMHADLAQFIGWKVVAIAMWLPVAVVLALIFRPEINPTWWQVGAFVIALWGGFAVRFVLLWALGMVTFWTTRVGAVFELYFTAELLLSGRLVPLALMPDWAQTLANFLPFKWAFGFPIEVLLGRWTPQATLAGVGAQVLWCIIGLLITRLLWRSATRRYSAVGA
jgi:ABC-2 type transport system permease protein